MSPLRSINPPPIRILIAERFLEAQARLEKLLSETDDMASAGIASTAQEAVSLSAELHPNLLLLDIDLPGAVLTTIKEIRQRFPAIQIIVLGYPGQPEDEQRTKKAGASAFLEKPFTNEALLVLIRTLFHAKTQPPDLLRRMGKGESYVNLIDRLHQHMESHAIKQNIKHLLAEAYEKALAEERVVLSRPERGQLYKRLTAQILQELLDGS